MSTNRSAYTSGHFLFHLDGEKDTSWLKSVEGGSVKAAVLDENIGPDPVQVKHLSTVEIEPLSLEVGMSASSPLLRWIDESWKRKFSRRSGSVVHANFNLEAVMEQEFQDALISEVMFPTLDGSDKNAAYMTVKLLPEHLELKKGGREKISGVDGQKQKMWTPSSFRLDINGVNCDHVNKVESFTVKQKIKPLYVGASRYPELEPTGIEFPRLTVTMAAAYADDFIEWHREYVVKGAQDPSQLKSGAIEFLDPSTAQTIFTIELKDVGISQLSIEKSEANAESIKRCKVELFVESMELALGGSGLV